MNFIKYLDLEILKFIQSNLKCSLMDKIMVVCTYLGNSGIIWIIICLLLIISKKYRKIGIISLASLLLSFILGELVIKHIVARQRPFIDIDTLKIIIAKPKTYSFPSGHTASSFAVSYSIFKNNKKMGIYVLILAALIAFSRLYLLVHYPSDVIAGIVLGVLSSIIVIKMFKKNDFSK